MSLSERRVRVTRDGVLFVGGLIGVASEAAREGAERPALLLVFGAMMGLPAFLQKDEKDRQAEEQKKAGRATDDDTPKDA